MRSGSERMHTWRRTPSTGRNFQTLIICITVSSCNGSISVNKFFFLGFLQFLLGFSKVPGFFVSPCIFSHLEILCDKIIVLVIANILGGYSGFGQD